MIKTYEVKLYPNKNQQITLRNILENGRLFYNEVLENKINTYKETGKNYTRWELQKKYKGKSNVPASYKQMLIYRVITTFERFFALKTGYPRFRNKKRFKTIYLRQHKIDYRFKDKKVSLWREIGSIPMKGFREPKGTIKEGRIMKKPSGWYLQYVDERDYEEQKQKPITKPVGLDMGLKSLVFDSEGNRTEPPEFFVNSQERLGKLQRAFCRKKKGSCRWKQLGFQIAKLHEHISNQRKDFLHKLSRQYVNSYDGIFVEDLNIKGMMQFGYLGKHISDASWGMFLNFLEYKSAESAIVFKRINPSFTTQKCSKCGNIVQKSLSQRTHICNCGLELERDYNSAINILKKGMEYACNEGITEVIPEKCEAIDFNLW